MLTIEHKKELLYNYIRLGLDKEKAYLLAECTEEDIQALKNDKAFEAKIQYYLALEEKRLLSLHRRACKIAAQRGSATGIQWRLAKMNPDRWGDKKETTIIPGTLIITKEDEQLL